MRFQAVLLLSIGLCLATSNGFFLKKAKVLPATLTAVKVNLVADATAAVGNLKEAGHLKAQALTGGIKAIGTAKLGVLKGIKDAKVGAVKAVVDAKLSKVAAVKASKAALAKTLLDKKLGSLAAAGAHLGVSSGISSSSSSSSGATSASPSSGSLASNFGTILQFSGDDEVALYPPANAVPTRINIITYKSSESSGAQSSGVRHNNASPPRPIVVPAPLAPSYGTPVAQSQTKVVSSAATNHEISKVVSGPLTSYGTPIRAIPPSTSYGVPILR